MSFIQFDTSPSHPAYLTLVNSDLTEGRGHAVVHSVHLTEDAAEAAAYGADTMGSDGTTVAVPVGWGTPGKPLFSGDGVRTLFGYVAGGAGYAGPRYTRLADVPDFSDSQWAEFSRLAAVAGHNPLMDAEHRRRAQLLARKEQLLAESREAAELFAVVTDDGRPNRDPVIVALINTGGDTLKATKLFVDALRRHPELSDHRLVQLFPGERAEWMFGDTIELPKTGGAIERLFGQYPDGTVFLVSGETAEYVIRNGAFYDEEGRPVNLATLVKRGIRMRTDADVADIAADKMREMLWKASRG